jgi:hypothetical protein
MCQWCPSSEVVKENWGLTRPMCETALKRLDAVILHRQPNADKALLRDYSKLYSMTMDKPLFQQQLGKLDKQISANASSSTGETNWLRLSSILSHFEAKCWFPKDVLLPMGLLSPKDFHFYIRRGYVLKDFGAGVRHGEFTHRLQWHVIMGVITNDFTVPVRPGWDHSPFELYVSLGKGENEGLWAELFDQSGQQPNSFRFPDGVHQFLLESGLGNLGAFLSKRETKRRTEFVKNIMDYLASRSMTASIPPPFFSTVDPYKSHQAFKQFELWFINQLRAEETQKYLKSGITPDKAKVEKDVEAIYNPLKDQPVPAYLAQKTADPGTLAKLPKNRTVKYVLLLQGAVYALDGTAIWDETAADQRAKQSRTGIFTG